jgi:dienelactone hydrolase
MTQSPITNLRTVLFLSAILLLTQTQIVFAVEIEAAPYEYKIGEELYEGFIARPSLKEAKDAAAVLIVHDWKGPSQFTKDRAKELANLGYIAFVVDLYGKGKRAETSEEASALSKPFYADRKLFRDRMKAALSELLKQPNVNAKKIGAMGFCFGGTAVLELIRSGAEIAGTVSFHGGLDSPTPEDAKNIKGKIVVLHGNLDPHVPPEEIADFYNEMNAAKVGFRFVGYPNCVHAFTNPNAGDDISKGVAYNADATAQAYFEMKSFFSTVLK